jgi:hypothetical protein
MTIYKVLFVLLALVTYGGVFWAVPLAVQFSLKEIAELHAASMLCGGVGYSIGRLTSSA